MKSSTVILSNSRHDHIRNSVVVHKKSSAIHTQSLQAPQPSSFCLTPKRMNFGRFAPRSFDGGSTSCEHVSTTNGAETVQGFWRSQERKDISRGTGRARISQHKLHHTHVSLFLHHTESVIRLKNTVTCTNRVTPRVPFSDSALTRSV